MGVRIEVTADPQKATVGDRIRIDIAITMPEGYQAQVVHPGARAGEFDVLDFVPGPDLPSESGAKPPAAPAGARLHRARIVAALYKTGEFEFPPVSVVLRDRAGVETKVAGPSVKVEIASVLPETDRDLKDPKKQAEIEEGLRWRLWLGLLAALAALCALAYYWRKRRRRPIQPAPAAGTPHIDPLEAAEAELRGLLERGLLEQGLVKQFYVVLAEIVKKIVEAGYGIQTLEKTTSEIVASLSDSSAPRCEGAELRQVEDFLSGCDLVKFAKYIPTAPENETAVRNAFGILRACRNSRAPAPPESLPSV